MLFRLTLYSQDDVSELTIVSPDKQILISVNGVRPSNKYASTVTCDGLDESNYNVKVWTKGSFSSSSYKINITNDYSYVYVYQKDNYNNYTLKFYGKEKLKNSYSFKNESITKDGPCGNIPTGKNIITNSDFEDVLKALRKEYLDNDCFKMAKSLIKDSYITSVQLKELIKLFTSKEYQEEMAKYGYAFVSDKHNLHKIYDAFYFDDSKDEVMEYIKGK